jgi:xanthine dehydrogenase small subunit
MTEPVLPFIEFVLDDRIVKVDFHESGLSPTTTVLDFLRGLPGHKGAKEGCAEGDCGACTVALGALDGDRLRYRAVDSCLVFLPMLHGKQLVTVENLKTPDGTLHAVQKAMIDTYGSQCGYCTPGIVMSLFALYTNSVNPTDAEIRSALAGNLCRCTGYKPIIEAARQACVGGGGRASSADSSEVVALLKHIPPASIHIATDRQTYHRPVTLEEALELRRLHPEALATNGGTDVALRVTKRHELLPSILDLSGIDALRGWSEEGGNIIVRSGTTIEEFANLCRQRFPALEAMLGVFGSLQIRNLATLGGNLGTASPVGDLLPVLIAQKATIVVRSNRGKRSIPADQFVVGYRATAAAPDELIVAVMFPPVPPGTLIKSYKISRRRDLDIATVSGAFRIELENGTRIRDVILAYGGMADRVRRAENAETSLRGKKWERSAVEEAMRAVDRDFTPISDVRGSAALRKVAARNLLLKFWAESGGSGGRS